MVHGGHEVAERVTSAPQSLGALNRPEASRRHSTLGLTPERQSESAERGSGLGLGMSRFPRSAIIIPSL